MQERVGAPSTCTVQAPHSAMPQPNLVPVMPSTSRSTHSSGVSPSTSTLCVVPLTLMLKAMVSTPSVMNANRRRGPGITKIGKSITAWPRKARGGFLRQVVTDAAVDQPVLILCRRTSWRRSLGSGWGAPLASPSMRDGRHAMDQRTFSQPLFPSSSYLATSPSASPRRQR